MDKLRLLCRVRAHFVELTKIEAGYERLLAHYHCKLDRCTELISKIDAATSIAPTPSVFDQAAAAAFNYLVTALLTSGLAVTCTDGGCCLPHLPMHNLSVTTESVAAYFRLLSARRGQLLETEVCAVLRIIVSGLRASTQSLQTAWFDQLKQAVDHPWYQSLPVTIADIKARYQAVWH